MQLIFFVPPNEELEGTLHHQKCGCTPKNEGKRVHVPPDEQTCGHAVYKNKAKDILFYILIHVHVSCQYSVHTDVFFKKNKLQIIFFFQ